MKNKLFLLISILIFISFPISAYSQLSNHRIGADVGFTTNKYLTLNISTSLNRWYYGLSAQINTDTGTKGKSYDSTMSWNNSLDPVSDTGKFYAATYGFDLGYYFLNNLCLGGGLGYASHRLYRNFYDDTGILHSSGWYHVTKSDGGKMEAKIFVNYYFKESLLGCCYIRGQYSIIGGIGAGVGFRF